MSGNFTTFTADGSWSINVNGPTWIHIENSANFGSGSIAVTFEGFDTNNHALQNSTGTPIAYTAGADDFYDFPSNTKLTLTMSGSTNPSVYVQIQSEPRR